MMPVPSHRRSASLTKSELIVGPSSVGGGRLSTRPTTGQEGCHSKSARTLIPKLSADSLHQQR